MQRRILSAERGEQSKRGYIAMAVIVLSGAVVGFVTGWFSEPTSEQQIRDTQLELVKDLVEEAHTSTNSGK